MKLKLLLMLLCGIAPAAWGWSNHTVGSYLALQDLPALHEAPLVEVEPLEQFLAQQYGAIAALLDEQERFARQHFAQYPPRPDNLKLPAVPGGQPAPRLPQRPAHQSADSPGHGHPAITGARPAAA